jgi:phosphocarrier protein
MIKQQLTIVNKLGLHARAAAKFVNVASQFESDITLAHNGAEVNGKSIMGLMMLAAGRGSVLDLIVDGNDAEAATAALVDLVEDRFGEGE